MPHATDLIRNHEDSVRDEWPVRTQAVSRVGNACVITEPATSNWTT